MPLPLHLPTQGPVSVLRPVRVLVLGSVLGVVLVLLLIVSGGLVWFGRFGALMLTSSMTSWTYEVPGSGLVEAVGIVTTPLRCRDRRKPTSRPMSRLMTRPPPYLMS